MRQVVLPLGGAGHNVEDQAEEDLQVLRILTGGVSNAYHGHESASANRADLVVVCIALEELVDICLRQARVSKGKSITVPLNFPLSKLATLVLEFQVKLLLWFYNWASTLHS